MALVPNALPVRCLVPRTPELGLQPKLAPYSLRSSRTLNCQHSSRCSVGPKLRLPCWQRASAVGGSVTVLGTLEQQSAPQPAAKLCKLILDSGNLMVRGMPVSNPWPHLAEAAKDRAGPPPGVVLHSTDGTACASLLTAYPNRNNSWRWALLGGATLARKLGLAASGGGWLVPQPDGRVVAVPWTEAEARERAKRRGERKALAIATMLPQAPLQAQPRARGAPSGAQQQQPGPAVRLVKGEVKLNGSAAVELFPREAEAARQGGERPAVVLHGAAGGPCTCRLAAYSWANAARWCLQGGLALARRLGIDAAGGGWLVRRADGGVAVVPWTEAEVRGLVHRARKQGVVRWRGPGQSVTMSGSTVRAFWPEAEQAAREGRRQPIALCAAGREGEEPREYGGMTFRFAGRQWAVSGATGLFRDLLGAAGGELELWRGEDGRVMARARAAAEGGDEEGGDAREEGLEAEAVSEAVSPAAPSARARKTRRTRLPAPMVAKPTCDGDSTVSTSGASIADAMSPCAMSERATAGAETEMLAVERTMGHSDFPIQAAAPAGSPTHGPSGSMARAEGVGTGAEDIEVIMDRIAASGEALAAMGSGGAAGPSAAASARAAACEARAALQRAEAWARGVEAEAPAMAAEAWALVAEAREAVAAVEVLAASVGEGAAAVRGDHEV